MSAQPGRVEDARTEDRAIIEAVSTERRATPVAVRSLKLTGFRNYARQSLDLDGRAVVLFGENGAGKTNLLEAVSLLAPGRGLRRARTGELERRDGSGMAAPGWGVAATVSTEVGPVEIGTGNEAGSERRVVRINGAAATQTGLGEYVSAVWLTPQMSQLFLEGASARRRFLDRLVYGFDPAHAGRVTAYDKALRDRSKILKDGGETGAMDAGWLDALEAQIAERGVAIAAARRDLAVRLARVAASGFGPFPGATVDVSGDLEAWLDTESAVTVEDRFRDALVQNRPVDAVTGGAAVGVHRSDLAVRHIEKDMPADQCSTGEQKALLMALVLSHARLLTAERGVTPLLLLDEVAAHLDEDRREALFAAVLDMGAQAWMTGTDARVFEPMQGAAQILRVADAAVFPA
ncbi:MAG: DNA replication/repair protein RecF [Alphaproteobacteria bacterium]